ncbi:HIT-like domain-containing protein [Mrakia frigida]|uniref:HIT-like domain-containing protein n=1 Tax=Mrakia frigida TaxID=29902 RepID=UPI003FCC087C
MSWSTALLTHALCKSPSTLLPPEVYLTSSPSFTVVNDLFPKSSYHALVLPRLPFPLKDGTTLQADDLSNLQTFVKKQRKEVVLEVLEAFEEMVQEVEGIIKGKMRKEKGWEWEVVWGFHAVPSMQHLHLHVYSKDLISPSLKNKKHYNSFNPDPEVGFFLPLETVKGWVEGEFMKLALPESQYEPILKQPLRSFYTGEEFKTIPKLKIHLEEELKKLERKSKKGQA